MGCVPSLLQTQGTAVGPSLGTNKTRNTLESDVATEREKLKKQQRRLLLGQPETPPASVAAANDTCVAAAGTRGIAAPATAAPPKRSSESSHDGEVSSRTETCSDFDMSSENEYSVNELVNIKKSHVDYTNRKRSGLNGKTSKAGSRRKSTSGSERKRTGESAATPGNYKKSTGSSSLVAGEHKERAPRSITATEEKEGHASAGASPRPPSHDLTRRGTNEIFDYHEQKLTHQEILRRTFPTRPPVEAEAAQNGSVVPNPPPLPAEGAAPGPLDGKGGAGRLPGRHNNCGNSILSPSQNSASPSDTPMGMGFHKYRSGHTETPGGPTGAAAAVATKPSSSGGHTNESNHSSGSSHDTKRSGHAAAVAVEAGATAADEKKVKVEEEEGGEAAEDVAAEPPEAGAAHTMDNEIDALMNQNNSLRRGDRPFGSAAAPSVKVESYPKPNFSFHVPEYNLEGSVSVKVPSDIQPPFASTSTKNGDATEAGKTLTFQNIREVRNAGEEEEEEYRTPLAGKAANTAAAGEVPGGDPNMYLIDKYVNKSMSEKKRKKKKSTDYDFGFAL